MVMRRIYTRTFRMSWYFYMFFPCCYSYVYSIIMCVLYTWFKIVFIFQGLTSLEDKFNYKTLGQFKRKLIMFEELSSKDSKSELKLYWNFRQNIGKKKLWKLLKIDQTKKMKLNNIEEHIPTKALIYFS